MSMSKEDILRELREGVLNYDEERVKRAAQMALENGVDPYLAITEGLTPAIREIGEKFERMEIFLPQLTIAAKAMEAGVAVLEPALSKAQSQKVRQGKVVIGTVQGDIHSIGKNIVATMLKAAGFEVIDLGVDVAVDKFLEAAERANADIIAASALMSFTKVMQRDLVEYMKSVGAKGKYKLMVGGGPVNEEWAREIGADGYAEDAIKAVKVAKELIEKKQ
ncbi:MAG: cobalamin B12-binding domain-containing protein [Candidatus Hadarchaeum sp.]|uniref:cobalamin B12-binding domain-containing protein n=1 Tax=Candidatus Hadarchaeum sp. TaxID=2883567 RepID=UPI003D13CAD9